MMTMTPESDLEIIRTEMKTDDKDTYLLRSETSEYVKAFNCYWEETKPIVHVD
jgi:hypothetical protein